jgi:hypothetical protein
MKKTLSILALAAIGTSAMAQEQSSWSISAYYSFCQKDYAITGSNRLHVVEDFLRKGWTIDLNAFAGVSRTNRTLAGFSGTVPFKIAKDIYFIAGVGVDGDFTDFTKIRFESIGFGVVGGIKYQVRF